MPLFKNANSSTANRSMSQMNDSAMSSTTVPSATSAKSFPALRRCLYLAMKRALDLSASGLGLVLLAPVFAIVSLLIRLDSSGPIFYRGKRTGRYGRPFEIYKFRSMIANAESCGGTTTAQNDPRVTKLGGWLRKYKLDELPQLINVFLGDMSLVGPRPEVQEYTDLFTDEEKRILNVRPGITDLSSLKFHDLQSFVGSDDVDRVFRETILPQKNALRMQYVDQQSFLVDLEILSRTIWTILYRSARS